MSNYELGCVIDELLEECMQIAITKVKPNIKILLKEKQCHMSYYGLFC
jgi:hypothetical protein